MTTKKPTKPLAKNKFTPQNKPTTSAQYRKSFETRKPTFRTRPQNRGR